MQPRPTKSNRPNENADRLPPHSPEAEAGLLGCCLNGPALMAKECAAVRSELFYDGRNATIWNVLKLMSQKRKVIDVGTVQIELKKAKMLDQVGGLARLAELTDAGPSPGNWSYYLDILREKFALRQAIAICTDHSAKAFDWSGDAESYLMGIGADLETLMGLKSGNERPILELFNCDDLDKYEPPAKLRLIGDNEISMGYEGITLVAGPGSVGKSMAVAAMALAGALGKGEWMGRTVHRRFKTLILQAENGKSRLKKQFNKMREYHKEHRDEIRDNVIFSGPPEGGLAFHSPEFRAAVRRAVAHHKPDLVVLDTWAQVAAEDAAKDVIDKLAEIRSCFPAGDDCPGLVIVAHTAKPRPEQVRKGRALSNLVSGSVALVNIARCVHMLWPFTEDMEDDRVYFCCPKLNNGENYGASVFKRRFGTLFEHDPETDPKTWGAETPKEDKRAVSEEMIREAFGSEHILTRTALAKRLESKHGVPKSTTYACLPGATRPYMSHLFTVTKEGWLQLKEEE